MRRIPEQCSFKKTAHFRVQNEIKNAKEKRAGKFVAFK